MTRRLFTVKPAIRYPIWIFMGLVLAVIMAGCAAGPPPGVVMGSTVAVAPGGDVGVAFGTGFGYGYPMTPEQREMMERRSRFYNDDYYDDYPYDWYW